MKVFRKILAFLLYIPLSLLFLFELYRTALVVADNISSYRWFSAGMAGYIVLGLLFRKNRKWLQTFSHELTHTVVGMLFFRKIHSFSADRKEGNMSFSGGRFHIGDTMIALSPYFLPLFTFFFLIIRHFIAGEAVYLFDIVIGSTFAFHLGCFLEQTGIHQTDIRKHGVALSYLIIVTFLSVNISLVLLSMDSNLLPALKTLAVNGWNDLGTAIHFLGNKLLTN